MRVRRWTTVWLLAMLVATTPGPPVGAQYADGLPAGLRQITVDGQPIDASTTPETGNRNPVFAGRFEPGPTEVELAIGNGEIVRFTFEVDPENGRFRGTGPDRLRPGTYALYVNDALVGNFVITEEQADAAAGDLLDLARLAAYPADLADAAPGLGFVDGRYYSLAEEGRRSAAQAGDTSREGADQVREGLQAAGFRQRYESRLATANPDEPTRFDVLVTSFVIEYSSPETAETGYDSITGQGEAVADAETIADASEVIAGRGVTGDTGAAFRSLTLTFRQDRLLSRVTYADLRNREPDLAAIETLGGVLEARGAALLAGEGVSLSPKALTLDLDRATSDEQITELYEALDGEVVSLYNEDAEALDRRLTNYVGTTDVFSASVAATVAVPGFQADVEETPAAGDAAAEARRQNRERRQQAAADGTPGARERRARAGTPEAGTGAAVESTLAYNVTLYSLPGETEAEEWLAGLPERVGQDPLPGYLSFAAVEDAPAFGDGSIAYAFRRRTGDATVSGYRYYVRVGAEVAAIELAAAAEPSLAAVGELADAQAACLAAGACPDPAPIPSDIGGQAEQP